MLISYKSKVVLTDSLAVWFAVGVVFSEFSHHAQGKEFVITSMKDGASGRVSNSLHTSGLAVDIKAVHLDPFERGIVLKGLKMRLEPLGFDCLCHTVAGPEALHFHIEYQPKPGEPSGTFTQA